MDIDRHETTAWKQVQELMRELRRCDLETLAKACRDRGRDKVAEAVLEKYNELLAFVAATPPQRKTALRTVPDEDRPLFLLQAAYLARCGHAFLEMTARYGVGGGQPGRMGSAQAARAAFELRVEWPTLWPFSDFPDPFGEEPMGDVEDSCS